MRKSVCALVSVLLLAATLSAAARDFDIYVIHDGSPSLSVIDPWGRTTRLALPGELGGFAFSADGEFAAVTVTTDTGAPGATVIRTDGRRIQATLGPPVERESGGKYAHAAPDSVRGTVWATRPDEGVVEVYNMWSREIVRTLDLGGSPGLIAHGGGLGRAFIFDQSEPTVHVVAADGTIEAVVALQAPVVRIVPGPAHEFLFFADADGSVGLIDTATSNVRYLRGFEEVPSGLAYVLDQGTLVVALAQGGRLVGISTHSGETTYEVFLDGAPSAVASSPDGSELYVALSDAPVIRVVRIADLSMVGEIPLAQPARGLGIKVSTRPCVAM